MHQQGTQGTSTGGLVMELDEAIQLEIGVPFISKAFIKGLGGRVELLDHQSLAGKRDRIGKIPASSLSDLEHSGRRR